MRMRNAECSMKAHNEVNLGEVANGYFPFLPH
jgi:hypothetical protein